MLGYLSKFTYKAGSPNTLDQTWLHVDFELGHYQWPLCGVVITCGHEWTGLCWPTRLWEDLCTSSNSSSLSSNSFWCICFILSISISNRMWIYQRKEKRDEVRMTAASKYIWMCLRALWAPVAAAVFWQWAWWFPALSRWPDSPGGEAVSWGQVVNPRQDQQAGWGPGSERTTPPSASADGSPLTGSPTNTHTNTCCWYLNILFILQLRNPVFVLWLLQRLWSRGGLNNLISLKDTLAGLATGEMKLKRSSTEEHRHENKDNKQPSSREGKERKQSVLSYTKPQRLSCYKKHFIQTRSGI